MIEELLDVGAADPGAMAEAAPWRAVAHPGAVWGPAKTIVWWRFADSSEASAEARWNELERADLAAAGCPLDPPELRIETARRRLGTTASSCQLTVSCSCFRPGGGRETAIHPLWHSLAARKKGSHRMISVRAEDIFNRAVSEFAGRRLARTSGSPFRASLRRGRNGARPTTAIQAART